MHGGGYAPLAVLVRELLAESVDVSLGVPSSDALTLGLSVAVPETEPLGLLVGVLEPVPARERGMHSGVRSEVAAVSTRHHRASVQLAAEASAADTCTGTYPLH